FEQVVVEPLPHRPRRSCDPSEGEEAASLRGRPGRTLPGRDVVQLLLEARQVLALALLELRQLALPLVVEALERRAPSLMEALDGAPPRPHHAQGRDEGAEAVRATEHGAGAVARERDRVLALTAEAADRHVPVLGWRNGEPGLEFPRRGRCR